MLRSTALILGFSLLLWSVGAAAFASEEKPSDASFSSRIATSALQFYQRSISPVNGDRCRMRPTCSEYAIHAIHKHGLVVGVVLAADRLMHEGEEIHRGLPVQTPKGLRYSDPLEANDFWMGRSRPDVPAHGEGLIPTFIEKK